MINHVWSILCKRTVIDEQTKNLTIFEVLEQINVDIGLKKDAPEQTAGLNIGFDYELVSFWVLDENKEGAKFDVQIQILSPEKELIKTFDQQVLVPSGFRRARNIAKISGITIKNSGRYLFKVLFKESKEKKSKLVAEIPLDVILKITKES